MFTTFKRVNVIWVEAPGFLTPFYKLNALKKLTNRPRKEVTDEYACVFLGNKILWHELRDLFSFASWVAPSATGATRYLKTFVFTIREIFSVGPPAHYKHKYIFITLEHPGIPRVHFYCDSNTPRSLLKLGHPAVKVDCKKI